jgi:hypothetical protein
VAEEGDHAVGLDEVEGGRVVTFPMRHRADGVPFTAGVPVTRRQGTVYTMNRVLDGDAFYVTVVP